MTDIVSGGCQCGSVRYSLKGSPERLYTCHCAECQTQSGSAFGMSMWVKQNSIKVTGKLKEFVRVSDRGHKITAYFCPECGVRIYGKPENRDELIVLKPGTLDDTSQLDPRVAIWLKSAQTWFELPDNTEKIQEQ